jgi:hypothetical protein
MAPITATSADELLHNAPRTPTVSKPRSLRDRRSSSLDDVRHPRGKRPERPNDIIGEVL